MSEKYENPLHVIADKLMDHFTRVGAVNYIEQTFENKEDVSKSFVLTMQMKDGETPCEKLATAHDRIVELEAELITCRNDTATKIIDSLMESIDVLDTKGQVLVTKICNSLSSVVVVNT